MEESSLIQTGVDKLVVLVRKNKRISIADAAKHLGVSTVVVEEWADFLEEEGIISVEYKFTTPYLVERRLTREEVVGKEKEFGGKKEAFVRRAEVTLALLDKESTAFQKIKEQFEDIKKNLGSEIKKVQGDLKELEKFENLKNNVDVEIIEQQKQFKERIEQIDNQIGKEEKKYSELIKEIDLEEKKLDSEKMEALSIREQENVLRQRLEDFKKLIEKLSNTIESEDKIVIDSQEHISRLKDLADNVKESVERKRQDIHNLFDESKKQEVKIIEMQNSILMKATEKKKNIDQRIEEGRGATKRFREFFEKKSKVEKMLAKISQERTELENELIQLIHKAKAFSIVSKSSVSGHISELKKKFKNVEKKKGDFEKGVRNLVSLLKK